MQQALIGINALELYDSGISAARIAALLPTQASSSSVLKWLRQHGRAIRTPGPVRNQYLDDAEGIAQWVFRKLCNHDLMRFRSPMNRESRNKETPIFAAGSTTTVLYPLQNGKVFAVTVQELQPAEIENQREALGEHYIDASGREEQRVKRLGTEIRDLE